jgi:hypothetical protein
MVMADDYFHIVEPRNIWIMLQMQNRNISLGPMITSSQYKHMDSKVKCNPRIVKFTTTDVACGLHYTLHSCSWKQLVNSYKTIQIDAANIQVCVLNSINLWYPHDLV